MSDEIDEMEMIEERQAAEEAAPKKLKRSDLVTHGLKALDVTHYDQMPVDNLAKKGEISGVDWMKVIDLGKALAAMQEGMPEHCRGSWGICARIAANAYQWQMDPFAIADQTYTVKNRLSYMSQLIHALINLRAPLQHRLEAEYTGEGENRVCTIRGMFTSGDMREYSTPKFKDIKPKNSPLWVSDADQQQFYFAVRSWGRRWVPEVLMGVYTKEEIEADRNLAYGSEDENAPSGLHARLKGSTRATEGHTKGHVDSELAQIAAETPERTTTLTHPKHMPSKENVKAAADRAEERRDIGKPKKKEKPEPATPKKKDAKILSIDPSKIKTVEEYLQYATAWIKRSDSVVEMMEKFSAERAIRNRIGVTSEDRKPLDDLLFAQKEKIAEED